MKLYNKSSYDKLKIKFKNSETIETNYSLSHQDMFVLSMLNGKRNGSFLEIGAYHSKYISNTYLLENEFGWKGISIDINPNVKEEFINNRKSDFILGDALVLNYDEILTNYNLPKQIDYLQIDIEPLTQSYDCLMKIPFDKYRFSVITYETDYYDTNIPQHIKDNVRSNSRDYLLSLGYELVVADVEHQTGLPYEDWYVDKISVNRENYNILKEKHNNLLPEYFLYL